MIVAFLFNLIVLVIGSIFIILPQVTTLPTVGGLDIDAAMVTAIGQLKVYMTAFWPLQHFFTGFLFLLGYFALKMVVKFLLGHRAPH